MASQFLSAIFGKLYTGVPSFFCPSRGVGVHVVRPACGRQVRTSVVDTTLFALNMNPYPLKLKFHIYE